MKGIVKTLNSEKGFGFIKGEDGKEYFFHRSSLKNAPFDVLKKGQSVEFEDTENTKGPRAEDIYV